MGVRMRFRYFGVVEHRFGVGSKGIEDYLIVVEFGIADEAGFVDSLGGGSATRVVRSRIGEDDGCAVLELISTDVGLLSVGFGCPD